MKFVSVIKFFALLFLVGTVSISSFAQQQLSLQQCVDRAMEQNIQIKISQLNHQQTEAQRQQQLAQYLPSLNGNMSHSYNFGRNVDPTTNQFTTDQVQSNGFSLSSSVTLFNAMSQHNSYKQSGLNVTASQYDIEKLKNDIALSVAGAYLQVLFNAELIANAERQLDVTNQQRDKTKKMVDAGSLARGSLLDVESQLANEELQLVNAQNQYDISLLNLAQLIDLESTDGFSIVTPELNIPQAELLTANAQSIYATAVTRQPEILAIDTRYESSMRGFDIARAARYPRLSLSGSLSTNYSSAFKRFVNFQLEDVPFQDQIDQNFSKSVSLNLSIPIFNNLQARTNVSRARISMEIAKYNSDNARLQLRKTIQQSYADALAALKRYSSSQKSVDALKEALRYTEQRFNVGLAISIDYTSAKNNLNKAESDLLQSKYDYIYKLKVLDFYLGKPLVF